MSVQEFLDMSGYGAYVWSCYGLTVIVLIGNAWLARRRLAAALTHAQRRSQMTREQQ